MDALPDDAAEHRVADGQRHLDVYVKPQENGTQRVDVTLPTRIAPIAGGVSIGLGSLTMIAGCLVWFPGSVGEGGRQDEDIARAAYVTIGIGAALFVGGLLAMGLNPRPSVRYVARGRHELFRQPEAEARSRSLPLSLLARPKDFVLPVVSASF